MRLTLVFSLLLLACTVQAQDILHRTDNSKLEVKVIEISDTQIRYKQLANPDGPTYVIAKDDVVRIVYESGITEVMPKRTISPAEVLYTNPDPRATDFGLNFISLNVPDLLFENLTVSYERFFKSGDFSMKVPVSIGLAEDNRSYGYYPFSGYYNRNKIFSTGFDFYFYPFAQGRAKFFFGPSFEYGRFKAYSHIYDPQNNQYTQKRLEGSFRSFLLQTGYLFQPTRNFNLSVNAGLGYSNTKIHNPDQSYNPPYYYDNYYNHGRVAFRGGMNIGYRF